MLIRFESDRACDDCGDPRTVVPVVMTRSQRFINLCLACFRALDLVLSNASAKLVVARVLPSATHGMTPAVIGLKREERKAIFLDLIKKRIQQLNHMGFLRSQSGESLARTESQLEDLDLNTLKAIARGAGRFVRAAKRKF
jgi:hypothetical protein